jgi:hypothetical protein
MFLRRRKAEADPGRAIADFWQWWPSARPRLTASIDAHEGGLPLVDEIGARVNAIHPDMHWELGKGEISEHALVVSPGGNPALRAAAARWLAAAPPADETWEFHDGRQRSASFDDFTLSIEGHALQLSELRFGVISTGDQAHSVDVTVYHPLFDELPEPVRVQITYLALDWALGENGVEIWVGLIEPMTTMPPNALTVDGLRAAVDTLIERHREPVWAMLTGQLPSGDDVMATAQQPLRSARWPRFDTHVALLLPYEARDNGFPTSDSLEALRSFEDGLEALLGRDGELIAHESCAGRRTLHYYVDGQTALIRQLQREIARWPRGSATVALDPDFAGVRHLAGS